jgi:hypothetical protein
VTLLDRTTPDVILRDQIMAVKKKQTKSDEQTLVWPFGKKNYILLGISLAVIIIGYICLGSGDNPNAPITLTVAPILLVIGYGMIPFAIMAKGRPEPAEVKSEESSEE